MLGFLAPEWFFLVPLLVIIGWKFPFLKFHSPLRLSILLLLLIALCRPSIKMNNGEMDVWVMVDQSDSAMLKPYMASQEIADILNRSGHPGDRVRLVDFAKDAVLREKGDPTLTGGTGSTRISRAIDYLLTQIDTNRTNRLLFLTDGYPTDDLELATAKLKELNIVADSRMFPHVFETDYRIAQVSAPIQTRPGESFLIEFSILASSNAAIDIPWEIKRGDQAPLKGIAHLEKGKARVRINDKLLKKGATDYSIKILPPETDPISLNNYANLWIEATGGTGVLLISPYPDDPMAPFLTAQGFDVSIITNPSTLNTAHLTGCKTVIINDVPAAKIPGDFLQSIVFFVNHQGGAFLMCGGRNSFGSGGYFSSPVDALLPVSMELRNEHRQLVTAISFVLDRSGSMSVSTAGGITKMQLANAGTINAINLLSDLDYVSVHAVDSTPHSIVEMSNIGQNKNSIINAVSRIESMGGGIFVEEGLMAAWKELKKTTIGTRHIILFSDASDSEEPGNYKNYLAEMLKEGITLSIIALGSRSDSDAALLEDMSEHARGRLFFSSDGTDLPSIFAQETVSIARSAFIGEKTQVKGTAGWGQIAAKPLEWPAFIDGYNLSYLKEGATAACLSQDEYDAPLVAFWHRGAGRTAAVSFPTGGSDASKILQWSNYGNFVQTLARWLAGNGQPEGFSLSTRLSGERLELELFYSDSAVTEVAKHAPQTAIEIVSEGNPRVVEGTWEHIEPGKFSSSFLIDEGEYVRGAVKVGDKTIPFGPISLTTNPEWEWNTGQREQFLSMIKLSGGSDRNDLASIWEEYRIPQERELTNYIIWITLLFALIEALLSRLGITFPSPDKNKPIH